MACPHVSGVAALCYAAGACQADKGGQAAALVAAAAGYANAAPEHRYPGDPILAPSPDRFYGFLAWGRRYWVRGSEGEGW